MPSISPSNISGIEQGRAAFAYNCVNEVKNYVNKNKEYKAYVRKIPMMIKTNGLGATFAYVQSKMKYDYFITWDDISGNSDEKLIQYINNKFDIKNISKDHVEKNKEKKIVRISTGKIIFSLIKNDEKNKAYLFKNNDIVAEFNLENNKDKMELIEISAYNIIYEQTASWLRIKGLLANTDIVEKFINSPSTEYRVFTMEILALFKWLGRFAEGKIVDDK